MAYPPDEEAEPEHRLARDTIGVLVWQPEAIERVVLRGLDLVS